MTPEEEDFKARLRDARRDKQKRRRTIKPPAMVADRWAHSGPGQRTEASDDPDATTTASIKRRSLA